MSLFIIVSFDSDLLSRYCPLEGQEGLHPGLGPWDPTSSVSCGLAAGAKSVCKDIPKLHRRCFLLCVCSPRSCHLENLLEHAQMILNTERENWEAEWDGEHAGLSQYAHKMQLEDAHVPEQLGCFYEFHSSAVA